ncbi:methyltransferase family protein [Herbihabitans rhizosphaerae]|uniref:Methyltransferase family protein n=1 Tax=Herbihabitans rhizosphaerae TaxID=1872711 RepID=A0A4Q7KBN7_9PSEU|nr:class I SAM-dependent methyltransferase [Herbihabitans rhizosphaerae]RZS29773.1 methyltransferase family protein [Herbihabitans rhizosphaerae]
MTVAITTAEALAWQDSWDLQAEAYLPGREDAFTVMCELAGELHARAPGPPRVLDLAGGTGSIALRVSRRLPDADVTLADVDPVLLAIARASLPAGTRIAEADLDSPQWTDALPHDRYDLVGVSAALHCLPSDRQREVYAEIHSVLAPGGLLCHADQVTDAERLPAAPPALTWAQWWAEIERDPVLGGHPRTERPSADAYQETAWHLDAIRAAGFAHVDVVWRHRTSVMITATT